MDPKRRVVNYALLGLVGVGGYVGTGTVFRSLEPPKKARLNAATFIDTNTLPLNDIAFFSWQKKPLFVLKKDASLALDKTRDVKIGAYYYTIMIGICTHLGCIPKYDVQAKQFVCPCHSGIFDINGHPLSGPVTRPLEIPPFTLQDATIIVGEAGEAYTRLMEQRA